MADRRTYRDRMTAAESFSGDLHATYGFLRLHLLGIITPLLAVGFLMSGKTLTGIALAVAWPAIWIEIAQQYGFERKALTVVGVCCGSVAALIFIWATILWSRAFLSHHPWSFP
jgi:hypothetical protein